MPRAMIQQTGARRFGPMAWRSWVADCLIEYAHEWGTYSWTERAARRKAERLLARYLGSRRHAPINVTPLVECGAQYGSNPDRCYHESGHPGPHSNRWGTTWANVTPPTEKEAGS